MRVNRVRTYHVVATRYVNMFRTDTPQMGQRRRKSRNTDDD